MLVELTLSACHHASGAVSSLSYSCLFDFQHMLVGLTMHALPLVATDAAVSPQRGSPDFRFMQTQHPKTQHPVSCVLSSMSKVDAKLMLPLSGYFIMSDMSAVGTAESSGIFGLANGKPAAVGATDQPHHRY